jgi:hypothetical protein
LNEKQIPQVVAKHRNASRKWKAWNELSSVQRRCPASPTTVVEKTAVRMSAAFPYVPPEARPDNLAAENGVHLGNGGYFDNSGVFALSEWLKEAVEGQTNKKRILLLELDAFPDSANRDTETSKQWYYQVSSPLETMLNVRSEAQVARDTRPANYLQ